MHSMRWCGRDVVVEEMVKMVRGYGGGKPGDWVLRSEAMLEWIVLGRRDTAIRRKTCLRKKK